MKNKQKAIDFWSISKEYINHYLPDIRKSSNNTISAYRTGINLFIDYLEENKWIRRQEVSFEDFSRQNLKDFMDWLINVKNLAMKTVNLRLNIGKKLQAPKHRDCWPTEKLCKEAR